MSLVILILIQKLLACLYILYNVDLIDDKELLKPESVFE